MRKIAMALVLIALLAGSWNLVGPALAQVKSNDNNIAVMDNCDPSDPTWAGIGGCALKQGSVTVAEFGNLLFSPLSGTIPVGHPSWRNEPSYITTSLGKTVRVRNSGGRTHTYTEVANFGGGFVPGLNGSLTQAPECNPAAVVILPPGATQDLNNLAPGTHKFQCCIHPWMRGAVEVE
jgi:plastocyanin